MTAGLVPEVCLGRLFFSRSDILFVFFVGWEKVRGPIYIRTRAHNLLVCTLMPEPLYQADSNQIEELMNSHSAL